MRKLHGEAAGVLQAEVLPPAAILADGELAMTVATWAKAIPQTRPLCMCCPHEWTSLHQPPPAAFVLVSSWQRPGLQQAMLCALCMICARHVDLAERMTEALKRIWPNGRRLARPHAATGGLQ